jgi:hypothetical protein
VERATTYSYPLGLGFETYNAIGALQTVDRAGNKLTGAGTLTIDGKDIPYNSVREYMAALSGAPELASCSVRKIVRYALARPLVSGDEPALNDFATRFEQGGRRYQAFIAGMAEAGCAPEE